VFADHDASGNNSVVECDLAKVEVAGSNPVSRSNLRSPIPGKVAAAAGAAEVGRCRLLASFGWPASDRTLPPRQAP
jgi:hypothetical protein